jgi:class 3 adenylate cyclase
MTQTEVPWYRKPAGWARNISLATWLAVAVLLVTVTSLVVTTVISLTHGQTLAEGITDTRLSGGSELKADSIGSALGTAERQVRALADSPAIVGVASEFTAAFAELGTLDRSAVDESGEVVSTFYRDTFTPQLNDALGTTTSWLTLVPTTDAATYLQRHYTASSDEETALIEDAGDGSTWSAVNREHHDGFLELAQRLVFSDIFIIEPDQGTVVYSVRKAPEFATSLDVGPHGDSTLASLMRSVRDNPQPGVVRVVDMAVYVPRLGQPMFFMAAPLLDGDRLIGVLAFQIAGSDVDRLMTSSGAWEEEGLGETGETYLVAPDGRMRSVARSFVEDPEAFLTDLAATSNASEAELRSIEGVGTTAVFLRAIDSGQLDEVATSESGVLDTVNFLGRSVVTATAPVDYEGLDWTVVLQIETAEINEPIADYRQAVIIAIAIFVITIAFAALGWSRGLFRPIRAISEKLRSLHDGDPAPPTTVKDSDPRDFTDLASSIDTMIEALERRELDLEAASAERLATMRSLLPQAVVERLESGDRNVVDQVPEAGVVVLIFDGLGDLVRNHEVSEARHIIDDIVEEIDALALQHGLERVKLVGDAYYAACGLSRPYLDHIPRSVEFAMEAGDILREAGLAIGEGPSVSAGIHTGELTYGLAGSTRMAFDIWGPTVVKAYGLARLARPNQVLISDEARVLLPSDIEVRPAADESSIGAVWEVTGHRITKEVSP